MEDLSWSVPYHLCSFILFVVQYKLAWLGQSSHYCQTHHDIHFWWQICLTLPLPNIVLFMLEGPASWDFPWVLFSYTLISISHLLCKWSLSWFKILCDHSQRTKPRSSNPVCRPKILRSPSKSIQQNEGALSPGWCGSGGWRVVL